MTIYSNAKGKMKKKAKKTESKLVKEVKKDLPEETNSIPEKPFDFGGLPDRNLKKNLGC